MGRQCSFPGCKNISGLHRFPADPEIRRQWMRALRLPDRDLPPRAGVCNGHFSLECFSNLAEVNMGYAKVLMLKSDAVPNADVPVPTAGSHIEPKQTREIGCQTEPVGTKHAAGQANIKPPRRSKVTVKLEPSDSELVLEDEEVESDVAESRLCLPTGWIPALQENDQQWIARSPGRQLSTSAGSSSAVPAPSPAASTSFLSETVKLEPSDSELVLEDEQVESDIAESRLCLPAGWIPALQENDQQWIARSPGRQLFTSAGSSSAVPAPSPAASTSFLSETVKLEPSDSELFMPDEQVESDIAESRICLPAGWIPDLPEIDQHWIAKALFRWSRYNQPELDYAKVDRMWWHPPEASLTYFAIPAFEELFGHPLFLWMPRKLWRVRLLCPHPDCGESELTSAGLHQRVRQVVGVSSFYYLASEYLTCENCKRKFISWSQAILSQLDIRHRLQFPCLLTYTLGCDMQVVRLMRQQGLGNGSSQLQKQLEVQHAERWLGKQIQFLTEYRRVERAVSTRQISLVLLGDLPTMPAVPKHPWLMQVYVQDVLSRVEEVKASITSLFGQVLKMDSTKKIVRKLAGKAQAIAAWTTNVCNEHGQVIMSVLTESEGWGLMQMVDGLVRRYRDAAVPPPEILYVDRDCCGNSHLQKIFEGWPYLKIKLDVRHFMRRIAAGCTTHSHALYTSFMAQLTHCIFVWDESDLRQLKEAKRAELEQSHVPPTEADVLHLITKAEMMLHCRRPVRDSMEMEGMLKELIEAYDGERGCDPLGVPLIDSVRMAQIWEVQRKHISCLQDPPGFQLYTQTGTVKKGGLVLPTYRCARGSASLENFHLHMNRFIPGTLASETFFQACLLDSLARWNEDRTLTVKGKEGPHSHNGLLRHAVNELAQKVLGRKLLEYTTPLKYTGELIGIEYLYNQNNIVMEDYKVALTTLETEDVSVAEGEMCSEPFQFEDPTVSNLDTILSSQQSSVSSTSLETRPPAAYSSTTKPEPTAQPVSAPSAPEEQKVKPSTFATILSALQQDTSTSLSSTATDEKPLTPTAADEQPSASSGSTSCDDSVGPGDTEGFGAVQNLAAFLFTLKNHSHALSSEDAAKIIALWDCLSEYDRRRAAYPPHHQELLAEEGFRATRTTGVESTEWCFAGGDSLAQWPDCNRICEALCVLLCEEYSESRRVDRVMYGRWNLVTRAYLHIRQIILNNAAVMDKTAIQLPVMNSTTIANWHFKLEKRQQKSKLEQGISTPDTTVASPESLPPVVESGSLVNPPVLVLPPNTAGMAQPLPAPRPLLISQPRPLLISQPRPLLISGSLAPILLAPQPLLLKAAPYTTQQYHKRKRKEEQSGKTKRTYVRKQTYMTCKQCHKERNSATHQQYFGNWYCQATATVTFAEWRAALEARGYGKKKDV